MSIIMAYPDGPLTDFFKLSQIRPSDQSKVTNSLIDAWLKPPIDKHWYFCCT